MSVAWHVRAMGAHGEGLSACIGGLGAAGCDRSITWGHVEVSHAPGGTRWAGHVGCNGRARQVTSMLKTLVGKIKLPHCQCSVTDGFPFCVTFRQWD